jgi:uncharacterized OB-fold protein
MSVPPADTAQIQPVVEGSVKFDECGQPKYLIGGRCKVCGTTTYAMRQICPRCWACDSQEETALASRGTLYSYTIVRNAPPGYGGPYAIAYVDLPENLRVMVRAEAALCKTVPIGSEVEIEIDVVAVDSDGAKVMGPVLRPANK